MGRSVNGASARLEAGSEGVQPSAKGLNLSVEPGIRGLAERLSPFALDCIPSEPALSRTEAPLTERPIQFSSVQSVQSVQFSCPHTLSRTRVVTDFTKTIFFLQTQKFDTAFEEKPPRRVAHVDVLQKKVCDQSALEPPRRTSREKFRNFPEPPLCTRFSAIPGILGAALVSALYPGAGGSRSKICSP